MTDLANKDKATQIYVLNCATEEGWQELNEEGWQDITVDDLLDAGTYDLYLSLEGAKEAALEGWQELNEEDSCEMKAPPLEWEVCTSGEIWRATGDIGGGEVFYRITLVTPNP